MLSSMKKKDFQEAFQQWRNRWDRCINSQRGYFEVTVKFSGWSVTFCGASFQKFVDSVSRAINRSIRKHRGCCVDVYSILKNRELATFNNVQISYSMHRLSRCLALYICIYPPGTELLLAQLSVFIRLSFPLVTCKRWDHQTKYPFHR